MNIAILITILNDLIWIFPIFRNWRTKFSYYFLILGITDPIAMLFAFVFHISIFKIYVVDSLLLIPAIFNFRLSKKHNFAAMAVYFLILSVIIFIKINQDTNAFLLMMILHIIVFLIFLKLFLEDTKGKNSFKLFYIILLLYEATLVLKFIIIMALTMDALALLFISTVFTCLIAVFFIIYNEENSPVVKLKSKIEIRE